MKDLEAWVGSFNNVVSNDVTPALLHWPGVRDIWAQVRTGDRLPAIDVFVFFSSSPASVLAPLVATLQQRAAGLEKAMRRSRGEESSNLPTMRTARSEKQTHAGAASNVSSNADSTPAGHHIGRGRGRGRGRGGGRGRGRGGARGGGAGGVEDNSSGLIEAEAGGRTRAGETSIHQRRLFTDLGFRLVGKLKLSELFHPVLCVDNSLHIEADIALAIDQELVSALASCFEKFLEYMWEIQLRLLPNFYDSDVQPGMHVETVKDVHRAPYLETKEKRKVDAEIALPRNGLLPNQWNVPHEELIDHKTLPGWRQALKIAVKIVKKLQIVQSVQMKWGEEHGVSNLLRKSDLLTRRLGAERLNAVSNLQVPSLQLATRSTETGH